LSPKKYLCIKFLGGYNFHGSLEMKVEGQTRKINTQQCYEVEQKTETNENALKPNKEQEHISMPRKQKLVDVKSH
jgi:hypothetical protein